MNFKLLGKNTLIYGIGNVGLRASAFLLIPLYTYTLSLKDYGLLATLFLTIQIMIILMSLGMRTTLLRFAKEYEKRYLISKLLGTSLLINIIAGIIITGVTLLLLKSFFRSILHIDHVDEYLALSSCVALVQTLSLHVMSYYQAKNEALKYTLVGISAALLLFINNLVLLLIFQQGLRGALIASMITDCAVLLFVSIDILLKRTGIGVALEIIPKLLQFGFPLIFSMLGQVIMGTSSLYFLSYFEGLEVVAIYSLGLKLAMIMGIVLTLPFQLAYQPFVFRNIDQPDLKKKIARLFTYFIIAAAIISFLILLASRLLLPFIAPPEYSSAYLVIILMLPAVACNGLIIFGETLLSVVKKTHTMGIIVGLCGVLSLLLNYVLIPKMGWHGAVIASNASFLSAGLLVLILGMKAFPMPIEWFRTSIAFGIFTYFLILAFLLEPASNFVFYGGALVATFLIIPFAKFVIFFNDREKAVVKILLERIKLHFRPYSEFRKSK